MYDLLVLALNEKRPSQIRSDNICLKALNKKGRKIKKYYYQIWPFINNVYGILYKIFTNDGQGEYECCDEMFEFNKVISSNLVVQERIQEIPDFHPDDCVSMSLSRNYDTELRSLLNSLLACSPVSTIAFLCRGQSFEKEIVVGVIPITDFLQMLHSGEAKTNVCYLVASDSMTKEQRLT